LNALQTGTYTRETRSWLNRRFDLFDSDGIYIPNQPAHGFSALAFRLEEYARMYAVLKVLNRLPFETILDVGSADGYGPALMRNLFDAAVFGTDLSDRALVRSRELFGGAGAASDAHELPFGDGTIDVCTCTEVLEHVVDPGMVIRELLRVARYFVILSTPRAPDETARERHFTSLDPHEPHAHIHYFTDRDILSLCGRRSVYRGARTRLVNTILDRAAWADDTTYVQRRSYYEFTIETPELGNGYHDAVYDMLLGKYQTASPWKKRFLTRHTAACLLAMDAALASKWPRTALDHLVIIPQQKARFLHRKRRCERHILQALLGGFQVEPLRRRS
jgi:2-polyprenyl-3-methyl-5-hydroxy-6-metoxy-1,4-benzoquinol methylase